MTSSLHPPHRFVTMNHNTPPEPSLVTRIQAVAQLLRATTRLFACSPRLIELLGEPAALSLRQALLTQCHTPFEASHAVRHHMTLGLGRTSSFDSSPFWCLIDGIGFWADAHPCRWRLASDQDRLRWLQWSADAASHALTLLNITVEPGDLQPAADWTW